ncbi:MAG: hypothetical protein A3B74_04835 [Candidatus Kerfeldbacteria bacterium RIFCSPHIGHO2_02_FULL_42_14]|uniref:Uncharacterized protein n=1 Tax=Candidatus Kerfeldbacteria bacterium RIFCSPHIGHO2_02_FULL_42_14 TaxID=1798540 RepID=A0A1G2ARL8_9BACT|nr:MAG: hypothetical protein A3B74_04835 [Candidatus Kerfeldbacteria bacterium RIFCSPHIGHO2_02_FULL_42_14]OGY81046.1 MAG: hypothetical protein A3E60_03555 [Candidatus Kerfeldbacteria bacterium RIFCSPHIGHO2_12_FULL_42_13]OGY84864.1 MAG: hypothetical protein A3I91_05200 [Candidatus Kerfeldbacteria bacterium RIFCSPLOWO2_02_FULL_42_19]OGY86777.1 MAG: hypothetical protein A3G01_02500 [Candidatus Kerfeldbacteria bacterium RIFCSPLOWO2_12_FULL_43_9]
MHFPSLTLSSRQKIHWYSQFHVLLIVALVIVLNILVQSFSIRLDLSEGKIFTLSQVTKETVRNLSDVVTVTAFFSDEFPPEYIAAKQRAEDILSEYAKLSSNIVVQTKDPKKDDAASQEAQSLGIPEIQFSLVKSDQFQVSTGYIGIALQYRDKSETIPVIQDPDSLEYDMTSALVKLTRTDVTEVAFTSGHGEIDTSELQDALVKNYMIRSVDLTSETLIDPGIDVLIIAGPRQAFTDRAQYVVDQFIMRGGKVLFFLDGVSVDPSLIAQNNATGLEALLTNYGVTVNHDLIVDPLSHETIGFQSGLFQIFQPYPLWPRILKDTLHATHPITASLESIVLGWASSMTLQNEKFSSETTFTTLAETSDQSWAQSEPFLLSPEALPQVPSDSQQHFIVAGHIKGKLTSFFRGKTLPQSSVSETPPTPQSLQSSETFLESTNNASVIVVTDSEMLSPLALQNFSGNFTFFANAVDVLAQDEAFIGLRSRSTTDRPLRPLPDRTKALYKYGNIFASVVLVLIMSAVVYFLRRRNDSKYIAKYGK